MKYSLQTLMEKKLIHDLDFHFSQFVLRKDSRDLDSKDFNVVEIAVALLSRQISKGNICMSSMDIPKIKEEFDLFADAIPSWKDICKASENAVWCGKPGEDKPVIFDGKRFYLHKYFVFESDLAKCIVNMSKDKSPYCEKLKEVGLSGFLSRFTVITGGPGTGKTTMIAKIVSVLWKYFPDIDIQLAAPTGKAASRMDEALFNAVGRIEKELSENIVNKIYNIKGSSIHRLLGWTSKHGVFRHNRHNPLSADVLIIDEASMVDLALMARLVDALKPKTSLILVGDKDQLTSVEAGNVLGDICLASKNRSINPNSVVELTTSYRFTSQSDIGLLASSINSGCREKDLESIFKSNSDGSVEILSRGFLKEIKTVRTKIEKNYEPLFRENTFESFFDVLDNFKILCASRKGIEGVEEVNRLTENLFKTKGLIPENNPWYIGRPVMVLKNSYDLELFNGECGVVVEEGGLKKAVFRKGKKKYRAYPVSILPEVETVYAMTVHKSQGSEYNQVMFILPEQDMAVLSKELVYTAVTRAKNKISIVSNTQKIAQSLLKSAARSSGLTQRLDLNYNNL